jgi:TolA-binding protein
MNTRVATVLLALMLAACAADPYGRGGRVGDLDRKRVDVGEDLPIEKGRERAETSYREFLETPAEGEQRAEAMRRLADLQLEAYDAALAAESEPRAEAPASSVGPEVIRDSDIIPLYEGLLEGHPNYGRNDQVRYQLARAYEESGQREKALSALDELVEQHPQTALIDEVQFRRGEILFVDQRYREAGQAYAAVVALGDTSVYYEHALYKQGWSLFKQSRYDEGLDAFTALLDRKVVDGRIDLEAQSRGERERVEDTLRAVSLSFWYQDGPQSVAGYFQRRGTRPYEDLVYASLGDLYLEKERYSDAAITYRSFVERYPVHRQAPMFQVRVIDAYEQGRFPEQVLAAKKEFVTRYALSEEYWRHHSKEEAPEVLAALKSNVTELAEHYHAVAQQTHERADYDEAARWYQAFLNDFPSDPAAPGVNFLLGELYFESGRYERAALAYERTAYEYPPHAKSAEAGYAALLAYERHEAALEGEARKQWHRRGTESALRFGASFPEHPQAPTVLARAAEDLFSAGELTRARSTGRAVVSRYPQADPRLLRTAWTVVGHSAFDLGDYPEAETAYQQSLARTPRGDADRGKLTERLAASVYKQGEASREAGDLRGAVAHFLRVGEVAPEASIRATAEYDAAAALISLEDWSASARVLEDFRARYPEHPLNGEVTRNLAAAYLESGQFAKAAGEFETLSRSGDPQLRREASLQAAELYERAGRPEQAIAAYGNYVTAFPRPAEPAIEARQKLAELNAARSNGTRERFWLGEIIKADRAAGPERSARTRFLAAKAQMVLAEDSFAAYRAVRLVEPLRPNLKLKKQRMEQALEAYGTAADYGVAEVATAATFRIASIYYDFSRAMLKSERPRELDGEALEEYELMLEEQAYPFEEKAIEVHEVNVHRIPAGTYDEWVKKSLAQLAELMPARYAKKEEGETLVARIQ